MPSFWAEALMNMASRCQGSGIPGIAQVGTTLLKILEVQEKPTPTPIAPRLSCAPRLFCTNDNGPDAVTFTELGPTTSDNYLRGAASDILFAYNNLLKMLEGRRVGDLRLQNGLAAAVAGLSAKEFFDLPEETQESHRRRFVRTPVHQQLAPDLVIYLGTPGANQSKPATSGRIQFQDFVQNMEFYPWDAVWDSQDTSSTALGWMTPSLNPQAHFILLSAIFLAWPTRWFREPSFNFASYRSMLLLYLKITLYHEFAHYLRSLAHGVCDNNTPEKCVDHTSKTQRHREDHSRSVGEAGRQAEAMAFGAVIDIALRSGGTPELLVSDLDAQGAPTYRIPDELTELLFSGIQPSAPIDLAAIATTQAPANVSGSGSTRIIVKESLAGLAAPQSKGKAKADPIGPDTPAEASNYSGAATLIPITGEDLVRIKALQPRLDVLKGSCVNPEVH